MRCTPIRRTAEEDVHETRALDLRGGQGRRQQESSDSGVGAIIGKKEVEIHLLENFLGTEWLSATQNVIRGSEAFFCFRATLQVLLPPRSEW